MTPNQVGTVFLVGAGPGDPELITVKGRRLLETCDTVVFDNLIPLELVVGLKASVNKVFVGKMAGDHTLPQDAINALLVDLAREGQTVVRLKGGDPFVFGRGSEEADCLKKAGIPFEIVPGITSGVAALAYAGIPCTDRHLASFCTFATGHKAKGKMEHGVPWDLLAKSQNGTLVVYMGVGEMQHIQKQLLDGGMNRDTPAAVIERGTFSSQKVVTTTLENLVKESNASGIQPPAIFVLGRVTQRHAQLKWLEDKPLSGIRVMVTRPSHQAVGFYAALRQLGADVLPYPTIEIQEEFDAERWTEFPMDGPRRWLVFTSENGVRYFVDQFIHLHEDIRKLGAIRIAAIGAGTQKALSERGLSCDFVPPKATVRDLAEHMTADLDLEGSVVVRVRGNLGDPILEQALAEAGASVIPLPVYQTSFSKWVAGAKDRLFRLPPHVMTFTSSSTVEGLFANLTDAEVERVAQQALIASIGPATSATLKRRGFKVAFEAKQHTIPGLLDATMAFYGKGTGFHLPYKLGD